ncbi:MAG: hypothetical protein ACJZ1Z_03660 [Acidimicrobiales bacterium]|jgi:hypothetical protein
MSIKVTIEDIDKRLSEYGHSAFVVTMTEEGKAKIVHSVISLEDDCLICSPGKGTLKNLADSSSVSLIFPPHSDDAYSMIIDGDGQILDSEKGSIKVKITGGVLHRPAAQSLNEGPKC